jgi:peroxiredoxin
MTHYTSRLLLGGFVILMATAATPAAPRTSAPDFALHDASGAIVKLSDYRGKVVLLDFWATWCGGCKTEIPWYLEFDKKYRDQGLASVGVAMDDEGWQAVKPWLAEHPISYPIVVADKDITGAYNVRSLPVTLLIDRDGRIAESHVGVVDKDAWEAHIQRLLSEQAAQPSPAR